MTDTLDNASCYNGGNPRNALAQQQIQAGSIVRCRDRQWVVLPSENLEVVRLRSLSGNEDEITGIYRHLLETMLASVKLLKLD
jgi:hypothetical protein